MSNVLLVATRVTGRLKVAEMEQLLVGLSSMHCDGLKHCETFFSVENSTGKYKFQQCYMTGGVQGDSEGWYFFLCQAWNCGRLDGILLLEVGTHRRSFCRAPVLLDQFTVNDLCTLYGNSLCFSSFANRTLHHQNSLL